MIGCERLGKRYGPRWLFRNLTFRVEPGECAVILGPNGSGKSTLLKILAGLLPSTEGVCHRPEDPRCSLGLAALDQSVYPALTLGEHFELAAELRGCPARTGALLEEVGLDHVPDLLARHLSTGMRARLKFALAVQAEPSIVLLDEPGAGLDEKGRAMLSRLIETRRERTAFVIATNDPQERRFATHELELVV
jgi:heme exporter protein A